MSVRKSRGRSWLASIMSTPLFLRRARDRSNQSKGFVPAKGIRLDAMGGRLKAEFWFLVSCPRNTRYFAGGQLAVFQGGPSRTGGEAPISESYGSSEQRGKTANWPRPRVAMKMGPRRRFSSVTYRLRYAPPPPVRLGPPCRRPILIATKYLVFRGQDTRTAATHWFEKTISFRPR